MMVRVHPVAPMWRRAVFDMRRAGNTERMGGLYYTARETHAGLSGVAEAPSRFGVIRGSDRFTLKNKTLEE